MTEIDSIQLDVREKLAHIDQMLADHDRKRQEIRYAPLLLIRRGCGSQLLQLYKKWAYVSICNKAREGYLVQYVNDKKKAAPQEDRAARARSDEIKRVWSATD
jgi:hypothetical protein